MAARRFPPVSGQTRKLLRSAELSPFAEQVSKSARSLSTEQVTQITAIVAGQFAQLIKSLYARGAIHQIPFMAGLAATRLRPAENRDYLFLQNQSGAAQMIVGIGKPPSATNAVPADGLILGAALGYWEPLIKPDQEIWIAASADNTPGLLLLSLPSWQVED